MDFTQKSVNMHGSQFDPNQKKNSETWADKSKSSLRLVEGNQSIKVK